MTRDDWRAIYLLRKVVACKPHAGASTLLMSSQRTIHRWRQENRDFKLLSRGKEGYKDKYEEPIRDLIKRRVLKRSEDSITISFGRPRWRSDGKQPWETRRRAHGSLTISLAWGKLVYNKKLARVEDYFTLTATPVNVNVEDATVYRASVAFLLEKETLEGYIVQIKFRDKNFNHFSESLATALRKADLTKKKETKKIMLTPKKN